MSEQWNPTPSRRLSKLPVPVAGFRKTKMNATFTASPLASSYSHLKLNENDESAGSQDGLEAFESPAKLPRSAALSHNSNLFASPTPTMLQDHFVAAAENRRHSLAPATRNSPLSTPPQRKPRKSLAPNAYGIYEAEFKSRKSCILPGMRTMNDKITVCIRKRPLSEKEAINSHDSILCDTECNSISVNATKTKLDGLGKYDEEHSFRFDKVFDENCDNLEVYQEILSPLVKHAGEGGQSTCFAYGQTGSGKTHTMFNPESGLCFLAASELFNLIHDTNISLFVSFYEIYQGQLVDLLRGKRKIVACEKDGVVYILGLHEEKATSLESLVELVQKGLQTRVTGSTAANSQSSRSHAVLQYTLKTSRSDRNGRISFIDLAGSERGADRANVNRLTKHEGSEINKSLLALKECIRAMDLDSARIPFRQSKLTMVLRDSFLGNTKTCMIATVSPAANNIEHTLNTLRYADRMKEVRGIDGESCGETVTQYAVEKENTRSPTFDPVMSPKSIQASPVPQKVLSTPTSNGRAREQKRRIKAGLDEFWSLVDACDDPSVLELAEEELKTLTSAFGTLS